MILAHSGWRKALATALAIGGFVSLYDVTMLDSKDVARASASAALPQPPAPGARLSFTATAYCKGAVTAAGVAAQAGVAAADPSLLPLGSVIELDSPDSRYDGIYSIVDTGPAVQGPLVDIYIWSCHEALKFGRRPVRLTVLRLGWNPKATAPSFMDRLFRRGGQVVPATSPRPVS